MLKHISENTLVPIGLAVVVIGGASMWVADTASQIKNNRQVIEELRQGSEASQKLIYEINSRLSRIEWRLEKRGER